MRRTDGGRGYDAKARAPHRSAGKNQGAAVAMQTFFFCLVGGGSFSVAGMDVTFSHCGGFVWPRHCGSNHFDVFLLMLSLVECRQRCFLLCVTGRFFLLLVLRAGAAGAGIGPAVDRRKWKTVCWDLYISISFVVVVDGPCGIFLGPVITWHSQRVNGKNAANRMT